MGYFEIKKSKDGQILLNLKANNGITILTSEGFSDEERCRESVETVKKNAVNNDRYEIKETEDKKFYFDLKADNDVVVGKSEIYVTKAAAGRGVDAVKRNAPYAHLKE
jgi:uncharacterized protein